MGRSPADLQLAVAVPDDPSSDDLIVLAYRLPGMSAELLLAVAEARSWPRNRAA
jgi:hypothetical protein